MRSSGVNPFTGLAEAQTLQVPITDKPSIWHLIYSNQTAGDEGILTADTQSLVLSLHGNQMHSGLANQLTGEENKNICVELSKTEKYEINILVAHHLTSRVNLTSNELVLTKMI